MDCEGGIDLTVLQDRECAQGQHMGIALGSVAAWQRARTVSEDEAETRQGKAKPGGSAICTS